MYLERAGGDSACSSFKSPASAYHVDVAEVRSISIADEDHKGDAFEERREREFLLAIDEWCEILRKSFADAKDTAGL
jgi:hypothetical protein